jgi:hypothetical protein
MNTNIFKEYNAIQGDSSDDTKLLKDMAINARDYISSFQWCPPIDRILLAYGVGGVVAVFLVEFSHPIQFSDKALWVIDGDIPSAYLVTEEINNPSEALKAYCSLMEDWINSVISGKSVKDLFPVRAEATYENAKYLKNRINFIKHDIIPNVF